MRDRKVKFAGYQHPHPLENDILVKIQASADAASDATPLSVLKTAVDALKDEVDYVLDNFEVRAVAVAVRYQVGCPPRFAHAVALHPAGPNSETACGASRATG